MMLRFTLVSLAACFGLNVPGLTERLDARKLRSGVPAVCAIATPRSQPLSGTVDTPLTTTARSCEPEKLGESAGPFVKDTLVMPDSQVSWIAELDGTPDPLDWRLPVCHGTCIPAAVSARSSGPSLIDVDADPALAVTAIPEAAAGSCALVDDALFAQIVTEMTDGFLRIDAPPAPLALPDAEPTMADLGELPPGPADEKPESAVVHDLYPGLAYELNSRSDGLGSMPGCEEFVVEAAAPGAPLDETDHHASMAAQDPSRLGRVERLASAFRLTGQALQAWVSIFEQD
jgi:hypothetical protein